MSLLNNYLILPHTKLKKNKEIATKIK